MNKVIHRRYIVALKYIFIATSLITALIIVIQKGKNKMTLEKLLKELNSIPKKHLKTDVRVSVDALINKGITENFWFTDVEVKEISSGLNQPEIIINGSE